MVDSLADFLALEHIGDGRFQSVRHQTNRTGAIFGGQSFALAMKAAGLHVPEREVHSAQASFLLGGAVDAPITYDVATLRDGGTYTTCTVSAVQHGRVLLSMLVSLKRPEADAIPHRPVADLDWPAPETLTDLFVEQDRNPGFQRLPVFSGIDIRPCDPDGYLLRSPGVRAIRTWFRARDFAGAGPRDRQAALAYFSDFGVPLAALWPHAPDVEREGLFVPTLNHSIWFTGKAEPSQWIAYRLENQWVGDGRALTTGHLYDAQGQLVATMTQENVMRPSGRRPG